VIFVLPSWENASLISWRNVRLGIMRTFALSFFKLVSGSPHLEFRLALRGLTLGPLGYDVELAHKAIVGFGWVVHLLSQCTLVNNNTSRLIIA